MSGTMWADWHLVGCEGQDKRLHDRRELTAHCFDIKAHSAQRSFRQSLLGCLISPCAQNIGRQFQLADVCDVTFLAVRKLQTRRGLEAGLSVQGRLLVRVSGSAETTRKSKSSKNRLAIGDRPSMATSQRQGKGDGSAWVV